MVKNVPSNPFGVPDLHYRDQERPPKSRRFLRNILFFYIVSHAYISEIDKGIIPNSLLKIRYGQVHHIGSVLGSWDPSQESPPKSGSVPDGCQIYQSSFYRNRGVWHIKLYVFWRTNPLVYSKSIMDIILGVRNVFHASGRPYQEHSL